MRLRDCDVGLALEFARPVRAVKTKHRVGRGRYSSEKSGPNQRDSPHITIRGAAMSLTAASLGGERQA